MKLKKLALFRFEASASIGAGHAMRSCVLADALAEEGWNCKVVTTPETYNFIPNMERFERIEPDDFYDNPILCDLLTIDNYDIDEVYETHFRNFAKKILVIDDLANRKHNCDILINQNFGFTKNENKSRIRKRKRKKKNAANK